MQIQCDCGTFRAEIQNLPRQTPGRVVCYCDDCQSFLHFLGRAELLDSNGGTEVIPVYPSDMQILAGQETVRCLRFSPKGPYRFYAGCCHTPLGNTDPNRAWMGIVSKAFANGAPKPLDQILGPIRGRIMGKFGRGQLPPGTPKTMNVKAMLAVLPFMIRGKLGSHKSPSPYFNESGTPIAIPRILTLEERQAARQKAGF